MSWYTTARVAKDVYRISAPLGVIEPRFGVSTANMYLVVGQERAALVDSGMGVADPRTEIAKLTSLPCIVLNTHSHWDHSGGNAHFDEIAIHESEALLLAQEPAIGGIRQAMQRSAEARAALPPAFDPTGYHILPTQASRILHDDDRVELGGRSLTALHTPGHSPGHMAYLDEAHGVLFTGDTAYRGPVYVCFEGADVAAFTQSIERLAALRGVTSICPGHNDVITDPRWLSGLAACLQAIRAGKVQGQLRGDFVIGKEFRCGAASIWLPQ